MSDAGRASPADDGAVVTVLYVHRMLTTGPVKRAWRLACHAGILVPASVPRRAPALADHILRFWGQPQVRERVVTWLDGQTSATLDRARTEGYAFLEELVRANVAPEVIAYLGYRTGLHEWLEWVNARMGPQLAFQFWRRWEASRRVLVQEDELDAARPGVSRTSASVRRLPPNQAFKLSQLRRQVCDLQRGLRKSQNREQRLVARVEREAARARRDVARFRQAARDLRALLKAEKEGAAALRAERDSLLAEGRHQRREIERSLGLWERERAGLLAQIATLRSALVELCAWPGADSPPLLGHRVLLLGDAPELPALGALVTGLGGDWLQLPVDGHLLRVLAEVNMADIVVLCAALPSQRSFQLARATNRAGAIFLPFFDGGLPMLRALLLTRAVPRLAERPLRYGGGCQRGCGRETATERRLRRALAEAGIPFEQEAPVAGMRVDFLIGGGALVVEVDGLVHVLAKKVRRDRERDAVLARRGYTVLRIPAEDLRRAAGVHRWVAAIRAALAVPCLPEAPPPLLSVAAAQLPTV